MMGNARWAMALIGLLLLSGCVLNITERNVIAPRADVAVQAGTIEDGQWTVVPLTIATDDGAVLRGARYQRPGSRAVALYFGGNGLTLNRSQPYLLRIYQPLPTDVIVFDHRGYGGSAAGGGVPTMAQLHADGVRIFDRVQADMRAADDSRPLIVHGQSLGSFVAGNLATRRKLDGLVLESSATTAEEWVATGMARMPWYKRLLVRPRLDATMAGQGNARVMPQLDEPVLLVVGVNDSTTPPSLSRSLFTAAGAPEERKELLVVDGAGHNDAALSPVFAEAWLRLLAKASPSAGKPASAE